ncbi:hypothetical protein DM02DRAFT_46158 [Periconia macrospinosa]|uniref:non-specific serine/threonine protein kinase n=1 Tax=Periconia macrospinosa TaxID=97972 RepID=A0A2V1DJY3_9PLEO|nr:hypothetical protein DM02DRAFT_46158 [Periconia macrospinosa]
MAIAAISEKYLPLKSFGEAGGNNNKGISLVRNTKTGEQLICKKVVASKAEDELRAVRRMRGFDNIIQLRDHVPSPKPELNLWGADISIHELYFEHCDLGSLSSFLKRHELAEQRVPESFIWHVLLSMAKALQVCHAGPTNTTERERWTPIAHRDVMAGNILLSSSPPTDNNLYPRVVLSDFGSSIEYKVPDPLLHRKDIGDLAETLYAMCFCAWDVENAKLGYSEELQGVLAVSDVYWEDTAEQAAKFNSGFVAWVEENMAQANMAEFEGKVILRS